VREALTPVYQPRHARPSCLPARAAVGSSLTAVLLPIALASPAIAEETVSPSPSPTSSPDGTAGADESATPEASPTAGSDGTATYDSSPWRSPRDARTSSPDPAPSSAGTSTQTALGNPDARRSTTMRISADPTGTDGRARIGVRLLSEDGALADSEVAVQALSGDGSWREIGRLVTDADGLATGRLPFSRDTRVRGTYAGSATQAPQTSPEAVVRYRRPTDMRISAGETASDGRARLGVRVLSDGQALRGVYVAVEALSGDGSWKYIGRLLTDDQGLAVGRLPFSRDTRVRSTFSGSETRLPRTSPEAVVRHNTVGEQAVRIAAEQEGKPYRYGATGPSSFDCSGFTTYIYKTRLGQSIPRTSAQQEAELPRVAQSAKRPGDLLFFRTNGRVTHVGVYAGGNQMWAAPTTGDRVKLQAIYTSSYTVGRVA
jgi:cell wall-associated NlpC family hydrolase